MRMVSTTNFGLDSELHKVLIKIVNEYIYVLTLQY